MDVMKKYDPTLVDGYIQHLAETAKDTACVAKEDVFNEFGVLLIKKGERITHQHSQRLNNHRLEKSVDEVVALENGFTATSLLHAFLEYFSSHPTLRACHDKNNF